MGFFKWQKAPSKKAPRRAWTDEEMQMIGWCMHTGIKISIMPDWKHELNPWQIHIEIKGKVHNDPARYDDDVLDKVYEYYKYYYDKYNKQ